MTFDVGAVVPATAMVINARLGLNVVGRSTSTPVDLAARAVTRAWTASASWNDADTGAPWTTPGGDSSATDATTASAGAASGWVHWYPTSLVQKWIDGSTANHGVLIEAPAGAGNLLSFAASENATSANRPFLDIYWTKRAGDRSDATFDRQQLTDRMDLGVDVSSGNLLVRATDQYLAGNGIDLTIDRFYSTLDSVEFGQFGRAWDSSYGRGAFVRFYGDNTASVATGDGATYRFKPNGSNAWAPDSPGIQADLKDASGGAKTQIELIFRGSEEKWTFRADGQLTSKKDRNGNTIALHLEAGTGYVDKITDTQGRDLEVWANADGTFSATRDVIARTWDYSYGSGQKLTAVEDPQGGLTQFGYGPTDQLTSITTPEGNVTKITYDAQRRVETVMRTTNATHTSGPTTTYAYGTGSPCATGETKTTLTDPNNHATIYCADPKTGQVSKVQDPLGHTQERTWTASGQVEQYTAASNAASGINTTFTYDATTDALDTIEQGTSTTDSLTTSFGYTSARPHQPQSVIDADGREQTMSYDSFGNLTSVADDSSPAIQATLTYDPNHPGRITRSTDPNGHTVDYGYDAHGNLNAITPQTVTSGTRIGQTTIDYDNASRPTVVTDGKGHTRTITYDKLDRITKYEYSTGPSTFFSYDRDGNQTSMTDGFGVTSYDYDPLNRMVKRADANTTTYGYDNAGNLTSFTDAGGTVTYAYNDANQLTSMTEPGSATTSFTVNEDGQRLTTSYPNGVVMTRVLDGANRLKSLTTTKGSTTLASYTYTYQGSQRASMVDQAGNVTFYTYGALGRLERATTHAGSPTGTVTADYQYAYDDAGNLTRRTDLSGTVTYAYNENNELVSSSAGTFTHDAVGQLTGGPGGLALAYNNRQQTTSITPPGGSANTLGFTDGNQQELYQDGTKTLQNTILGVSRTSAGSASTYYGRDNTGTLVSVRNPSATSYVLYDGQGSVSALTNVAGTITDTWSYDPYGRRSQTSGSSTQPFGYNAGYTTNGLVHYRARLYRPELGRWTQQDPLNQPADLLNGNRYGYAFNDPINHWDPSGLQPPNCNTERGQKALRCVDPDPGAGTDCALSLGGGLISALGVVGGGPAGIGLAIGGVSYAAASMVRSC